MVMLCIYRMRHGPTHPYRAWQAFRRLRNKHRYKYTTGRICVRLCTDASTNVRGKIWMHLLPKMSDLRGPGHTRVCECLLLLQCAYGKERTGAYPKSSCSLTDTRPGDSASSLCSRGRESTNEQEPQTVLAGERALTAARSPSLAASCSLPPSTSPAAAFTGNAESPQVDAGDDPPTTTAEPRSPSCNRRWQHLLSRRAQYLAARHARIAPAKPCGPQCRCPEGNSSPLGIGTPVEASSRPCPGAHDGLSKWGPRRPFPGATGTLQETRTGARPGRATGARPGRAGP